MAAAWDDWQWVVSVDVRTFEEWNPGRAIDKTLWNLCNAYNVSVVGIDIGIPTPKRSIIEVPYRSGSISLTKDEDVMYEPRRVSLRFETTGTLYNGYAAFQAFSNTFHGRTGYIYKRQGTPDFGYNPFFRGTMELSKIDLNGSTFRFSIDMDAFPFNILSFPTSQTVEVYNDEIDFPDIIVPSEDYRLFVSVDFDTNYQTAGVNLFGNWHLGPNDQVIIPWGAGSSSLFNANMYIPYPTYFFADQAYKFWTNVTPIQLVQPGQINGKITVRYMLCQL